jgi:hypothetical protein
MGAAQIKAIEKWALKFRHTPRDEAVDLVAAQIGRDLSTEEKATLAAPRYSL